MNITGSLRYFISLALKSLWQEKKVHFQAIFSLYLVLMCILSLLFISQNLQQSIAKMASQVQISVYLIESASQEELEKMQKAQCQDQFIDRCLMISSDQAKQKFLDNNPNLKNTVQHLENNPFPHSIEMIMKKDFVDEQALKRKIVSLEKQSMVEEVVSDQVLAQKWFTLLKILRWTLTVVIVFSLLVLLGMTSHVVGLLTYMKQKQIEIMSLIGATDAMISIIFMTSALLNSLIALGLALLSFIAIITWLEHYLRESLNMPWLSLNYFNGLVLASMFVFAIVVGIFGGYVGVKRFLK